MLAFFCLLTQILHSQSTEPVLFTIEGEPVTASEFVFIYSKTNQDKADFSEQSLREYLDLYTKFKLKVKRARDMQLDTAEALQRELEGYRRQLANSYLIDKEVTERLVEETHRHMQQDVDISHIFLACPSSASPADTLAAFARVSAWINMLRSGTPFEQLASDSSQDQTARDNKGHLGYVTAMLPSGYYTLEKVAYNSKPGTLSGPIRSANGYHILRVNGFRPARGEMEVAHLLLRSSPDPLEQQQTKARVDSLYMVLTTGQTSWEAACARFSDDKATSDKGGYLGVFGINRYQRSFEDAAFALDHDGAISPPVETGAGWHLIRRIASRPVPPIDQMRRPLTERIKRDPRNDIAKRGMIDRIKRENNYTEYPAALVTWRARQIDTVFLTYRWKPDPTPSPDMLASLGTKMVYTIGDFEAYCARSGRERMRGSGYPLNDVISQLYQQYTDDVVMQFEESQLEQKYPEFKSLIREYEEGILLFDATKQLVWDRANADTIGLQQHFDANLKGTYMWGERAETTLYNLNTADPKTIDAVRKLALTRSAEEVRKKFKKKLVDITTVSGLSEKGKNKALGDLWSSGAMTDVRIDAASQTASFIKIERLVPPMPKALHEARGYAVADYQDQLEKQWVEELRKRYNVVVNEAVFKSLVKQP
jgi:peptidyl-prolyl cis-trans isomerase SurA